MDRCSSFLNAVLRVFIGVVIGFAYRSHFGDTIERIEFFQDVFTPTERVEVEDRSRRAEVLFVQYFTAREFVK